MSRFQALVAQAKKGIREISPADAAKQSSQPQTLIVDVRDPDESAENRITGAKAISRGTLEIEIEEIAPDLATPIICYCGGGGRAALATESLQRMGYKNVKSIAGGFKAWKAAGLPTEGEQDG